MSYQVLARRWRPLVFDDVVNQIHVKTTLINAIKQNRIAHAYIFAGPRGVGKTTIARILARALNCEQGPTSTPCNTCSSCTEILEDRSMDVLEIDGASNRGIEDVRNIRENVKYSPVHGKYRIYIIDEVHMLTREAFNALLKTLEEPPSHVLFIFATTEFHKIPATIYSRCQRFDFKRLSLEEIVRQIDKMCRADNITISNDALVMLSKHADGSMRDGQSLLDQILASVGNDITADHVMNSLGLIREEMFFRCSDGIITNDTKAAFDIARQVFDDGYDVGEFINGILEHFRNLLMVKVSGNAKLIETTETIRNQYVETAEKFSEMDMLRIVNTISDAEQSIKKSSQPVLRLELLMTRLFALQQSVTIDQIIDSLDHTGSGGSSTVSGTGGHSGGRVKPRPVQPEEPDDNIPVYIEQDVPPSEIIREPEKQPEPSVIHDKPTENIEPEPVIDEMPPVPQIPEPHVPPIPETPAKNEPDTGDRKDGNGGSISDPDDGQGSLTFSQITNKWNSFIKSFQNKNAIAGEMLSSCKPTAFNDNVLELTCFSENGFNYDMVRQRKQVVSDEMAKFFGERIQLIPVKKMKTAGGSHQSMKKAVANPSETALKKIIEKEPVIKRIIDAFDGRSVRVVPPQ